MGRWEETVSHSLLPFTRGASLPYRSTRGVLVTAARVRDGVWVGPRRGSAFHLALDAAVAWEDRGPVYGGRWLCGGTSIGIRFDSPERLSERWGKAMPEDASDALCWKCRAVSDGTVKQPVVYRAFDKNGELLYIGSTKSLPNRLSAHRTSTWWWPVVKRIEHHDFPTLEAARDAERVAIRAEHPKMNVQHNRAAS